MLAAGLLGIREGLELTIPPSGALPGGGRPAPRAAAARPRASRSRRSRRPSRSWSCSGHEFVDAWCAVRRYELQRFDDHVTDWERDEYLEIY